MGHAFFGPIQNLSASISSDILTWWSVDTNVLGLGTSMPLAQSSVIDDTNLVDNWSLLLTNKSKCTKEGFSSYSNDSSLVGSKYAYELSFSLFYWFWRWKRNSCSFFKFDSMGVPSEYIH